MSSTNNSQTVKSKPAQNLSTNKDLKIKKNTRAIEKKRKERQNKYSQKWRSKESNKQSEIERSRQYRKNKKNQEILQNEEMQRLRDKIKYLESKLCKLMNNEPTNNDQASDNLPD